MIDRRKLKRWMELQIPGKDIAEGVPVSGLPKRSRPQELARRMGYVGWQSPGYIYNVLNGKQEVGLDWVVKCASCLGIKPYYLLSDEINRMVVSGFLDELSKAPFPEVVAARFKGLDILRSDSEIVTDLKKLVKIFPEETRVAAEDGINVGFTAHVPADPDAFSLYVNDPAMSRAIPPGAVIIVSPSRPVESGHMYYLELADGTQLVRLLFVSGDRYILQALDDQAPPRAVAPADVKSINRVLSVIHS